MIRLTDIKDWLKAQCNIENGYVGRIDASVNNCIGVYALKPGAAHRPFARLKAYDEQSFSILVHGSTSKAKTEELAWSIYAKLNTMQVDTIAGVKIIDLQLLNDAPVDVDKDTSKIYEYVIEFKIIMEVC